MAASMVKVLTDNLRKTLQANVFDRIYKNIKVVSAGEGFCVCEMVVEEDHQNRKGTLHGGMTAALIDSVTSMALSTVADRGVSVDMNVTYMSAVKTGDEIVIDARVLKHGKTMAFLTADIKEKASGRLIAQGRHTKYIPSPKPSTEAS